MFVALGAWAPRRLEVAWVLPIGCSGAPTSLYFSCEASGNHKLDLCVSLEKRWELEETPSLCGYLNNEDIGKPLWLS